MRFKIDQESKDIARLLEGRHGDLVKRVRRKCGNSNFFQKPEACYHPDSFAHGWILRAAQWLTGPSNPDDYAWDWGIPLVDEELPQDIKELVDDYAFRKDPDFLSKIPKDKQTEEMILDAVKRSGDSIRFAADVKITQKIVDEAIKESASAISYIPHRFLTVDLFDFVIEKDPGEIWRIERCFKDVRTSNEIANKIRLKAIKLSSKAFSGISSSRSRRWHSLTNLASSLVTDFKAEVSRFRLEVDMNGHFSDWVFDHEPTEANHSYAELWILSEIFRHSFTTKIKGSFFNLPDDFILNHGLSVLNFRKDDLDYVKSPEFFGIAAAEGEIEITEVPLKYLSEETIVRAIKGKYGDDFNKEVFGLMVEKFPTETILLLGIENGFRRG